MYKKLTSLLYVEDDDTVRENIAEYFSHNIQNVYVAKNGEEGLLLFKKYKPQAVISDIAMPRLNGIIMLKKIRDISPVTQFVVTTSFDDKEYLIEAVNLQLTNYIFKPLTLVKLEKVLKLCESKIIDVDKNLKYFTKDIYFDTLKKELFYKKESIILTVKERELLELLIKTNPSPMSYELVYSYLYEGIPHKDAVKTLIKILRKKITNSFIETIYGYGYKLNTI